ncbi:hypothetical protein MWU65_05940 [Cellulophaga sp. F20128]|uniref:hypothetical protein n=1 Tax=Cellulophaga sp. F20128 TaxID=2926413 RepID=UPI001FF6EA53|nr:hypothetical protein [Cellulophaga sp. F20128]MCK0156711.1 hypothetical protein [Cellulophaga sp. F20128]
MKKITLLTFVILMITSISFAQKKSDLLFQIENLKDSIAKTNTSLAEAKKSEKVSLAKSELFESQATELQEANKSLLNNLKSFTQVSSQNSKNMERTLVALQTKEAQLSILESTFSKNDSTAIVILTNAKQTLGENASVTVTNGEVVITENTQNLLDASKSKVSVNGESFLEKLAKILLANQNSQLTITGKTDGLMQITNALITTYSIVPERISLNFVSTEVAPVLFKINPNYPSFYTRVREHVKKLK